MQILKEVPQNVLNGFIDIIKYQIEQEKKENPKNFLGRSYGNARNFIESLGITSAFNRMVDCLHSFYCNISKEEREEMFPEDYITQEYLNGIIRQCLFSGNIELFIYNLNELRNVVAGNSKAFKDVTELLFYATGFFEKSLDENDEASFSPEDITSEDICLLYIEMFSPRMSREEICYSEKMNNILPYDEFKKLAENNLDEAKETLKHYVIENVRQFKINKFKVSSQELNNKYFYFDINHIVRFYTFSKRYGRWYAEIMITASGITDDIKCNIFQNTGKRKRKSKKIEGGN